MFPSIGKVGADHAAFGIQRGHMPEALDFFDRVLGWTVLERAARGKWGVARFVQPPDGNFLVQLTDEADSPELQEICPSTHLAVQVYDAERVTSTLATWAKLQGLRYDVQPANPERTKMFFELDQWFTFSFEFITRTPPA